MICLPRNCNFIQPKVTRKLVYISETAKNKLYMEVYAQDRQTIESDNKISCVLFTIVTTHIEVLLTISMRVFNIFQKNQEQSMRVMRFDHYKFRWSKSTTIHHDFFFVNIYKSEKIIVEGKQRQSHSSNSSITLSEMEKVLN